MLLTQHINDVVLSFSETDLQFLNIILGLIVFGISLNLTVNHFKEIFVRPKSFFVGSFSQILLLPALTFIIVLTLKPAPSLALGMLLVAACPGGNLSNFAAQIAKGNAALSISLSTSSTLLSSISTPFLFAFFANQYEPASGLLSQIELEFIDMLKLILVLIAIPLILGMLLNHFFPKIAQKLHRIMTIVSMLFFGAFVVLALHQNSNHLFEWFTTIFYLVVCMNVLAYLMGYSISKIFKLPLAETKTITLETGIQNSGLGMILIVNFFNGMGGMMLVAAFWGIWHIISSLSLAWFWKRYE